MEVFNNPTLRLWADPLQFLHHKDYGGVDVVTSHRNQVYPDLYIGESGQFDLHHRKQRSELLVQTQDIQSFMKWVPHPLCPMNPIESLDLQKRISEMKEAKAAHQAESRIYEAAVAIQSKVRQMQATLQATITSSKQQGSSQAMIPKTQAGKLSKKTSEQSEQGKSLQSKQHNSEGLLQSEQSTNHKINDNMPKISAKQRRAKKGVEGSSTKKGVKESSTYFTVGFKPQAETVFSSKTKSGPEQSNDIDSGNAEHVNNISGLNAKKGTRKPQLMAVSKTFNKTFNNKDVKLQPNEDPLHFGFELHATRVAQRDGPSDGHRGGGRNGGRGKFNRGGRGNPGSRGNRRGPRTANRTEKEVTNLSSTYFSDKFRTEADAACSIENKSDPKRCNIGSSKAELVNKDVKSEPTGDSLLQHFGFELDATRVVQRDGPSDGRRRGGCGGGPRTANRGGRGLSNHGAQGAVSKNRTSLDPSVNIGCAELLSYTAYGEYPRVKAFQNSAAFVSAAFGGSGIQFNGTRFAPVNESYR